MSGWIRVARNVFDHGVFAHEPFSEREAWLWLVAKAAWKDTTHRIGSQVCAVPRGSLFVTLRELQTAWRWGSDGRVRRFLEMLENQRMIERTNDAGKTHVTICNYSKFQDAERENDAKTAQETTQPRRNDDALKEEGNKKEDNIPSLRSGIASARETNTEKPFRKKTATPAPEGFWPDETGMRVAAENGMSSDDIRREVTAMLDRAKRDSALYADWQAAWRTWCRNFQRFRPNARAGPSHAPPRRGSAGMFDALQEIRREMENGARPDDFGQFGSPVLRISSG